MKVRKLSCSGRITRDDNVGNILNLVIQGELNNEKERMWKTADNLDIVHKGGQTGLTVSDYIEQKRLKHDDSQRPLKIQHSEIELGT